MQPITIAGYDSGGLQNNKKPFLLPDQAFHVLYNAYVWRDRVKKREGIDLLGRLRRVILSQAQANADGSGSYSIADLLSVFRVSQPNAELEPGSVILSVGAGLDLTVFTDQGDGTFLRTSGTSYQITASSINYISGAISLTWDAGGTPPGGTAVVADFSYFPSTPCMGIILREQSGINNEQTIFFDKRYAYIYNGAEFVEFISGTTWNSSDSDFFWGSNYVSVANTRVLFVTNFVQTDPIRYTDGATWTNFNPYLSRANPVDPLVDTKLYQARVIIPYYGRLLALNTFEGTESGGYAGSVNFFNRCRFSQIGNPTEADAWRSDQFGKGGFIDAPVNEEIISAAFIKNTLIVFFERSTWQLRYVGEYGLPFIWERVSSDFGSESTFSTVIFNDGVLAIGDRAIINANAVGVERVDLQIPDLVFNIRNASNGVKRVQGVRDYFRELVFWNFPDWNSLEDTQIFPNRTLVYNYRNNTYAIFRENITAFGTIQLTSNITWDRTDIFWDDLQVFWDDTDYQSQFPAIVIGNQQGFIHTYGLTTAIQDDPSLTVSGVNLTVSPNIITSVNHNLSSDEIIYLTDLQFATAPTESLNERLFKVTYLTKDTFSIMQWNSTTESYENTPSQSAVTYIGGGEITLFPRMHIESKDFNPYMGKGKQGKLIYIDFLTDANPDAVVSIDLFINSAMNQRVNTLVGTKRVESYLPSGFYIQNSDYSWHRCYCAASGQYIRVVVTYDDELMNDIETHRSTFVLDAMTLWMREGGKSVF